MTSLYAVPIDRYQAAVASRQNFCKVCFQPEAAMASPKLKGLTASKTYPAYPYPDSQACAICAHSALGTRRSLRAFSMVLCMAWAMRPKT
jgi:hypothetical protein